MLTSDRSASGLLQLQADGHPVSDGEDRCVELGSLEQEAGQLQHAAGCGMRGVVRNPPAPEHVVTDEVSADQ